MQMITALDYAQENGMKYMETSAKTGKRTAEQ